MESFGQRAGTVIKLADKGQRRVYSATLASIALGVAILAGGGLLKSAQAHAASLIKDVTAEGSDDGTSSTASSPNTSTSSTPPDSTSSVSSTSTNNAGNTSPASTQYYQQPMSSVS